MLLHGRVAFAGAHVTPRKAANTRKGMKHASSLSERDAIVVLVPSTAKVASELRVMATSLHRLHDGGRTPVLLMHEKDMPTTLHSQFVKAIATGSGR